LNLIYSCKNKSKERFTISISPGSKAILIELDLPLDKVIPKHGKINFSSWKDFVLALYLDILPCLSQGESLIVVLDPPYEWNVLKSLLSVKELMNSPASLGVIFTLIVFSGFLELPANEPVFFSSFHECWAIALI